MKSNFFIVRLKTFNNLLEEFKVHGNLKVKELKEMIKETLEIETDQQRLIYTGQVLENEKTLNFYKVDSGMTILLFPKN